MPPKGSQPSKKTEQKRLDKIVEDKTFGLKNKNKSKTVQNFVKSVANQVKGVNVKGGESKRLADEFAEKAAKKKEEEKKALLSNLFKSVKKVQEEVEEEPEEVQEDENYQEIDFYTDQRDQIFGGGGDVPEELANWQNNKIDKMCRHFLDAAESGKYGWRWVCPNGIGCIYRHALPAGFTLKRDLPQEEKKLGGILEEELEIERSQLQGGTPVTLERFLKWKEDKKLQREKDTEKKRQEEAKKSGGKGLNVLSGRALFTYDPTLFKDDEEALGDEEYQEESEEEKQEEGIPEEGEDEEDDEEEEQEPVGRDWGGDDGVTKVRQTETNPQAESGEPKKKKKKKKKVKKAADEDENVKINEDVFLGEDDVELPEDDS